MATRHAPDFIRFLLGHLAVGVGVGWTVLGVVCALDMFGLRTLITTSSDGALAGVLLAFFFALTFGSLGMGFGVMSPAPNDQTPDEGTPPGGGLKRGSASLVPATARARTRRRT